PQRPRDSRVTARQFVSQSAAIALGRSSPTPPFIDDTSLAAALKSGDKSHFIRCAKNPCAVYFMACISMQRVYIGSIEHGTGRLMEDEDDNGYPHPRTGICLRSGCRQRSDAQSGPHQVEPQ